MKVSATIALAALAVTWGSATAIAQSCTRQGVDVSCDDGRRGGVAAHKRHVHIDVDTSVDIQWISTLMGG